MRPQYDDVTGEAVGFRYTDLRTHSTYIIAYAMWYATERDGLSFARF